MRRNIGSLIATAALALASANAAADLNAGLAARYQFDGNALDAGPSSYSGTVVGAPTFEAGKIGQAFRADGNANYVHVSSAAGNLSFDPRTQSYSISTWIKIAALSNEFGDLHIIKDREIGQNTAQSYGLAVNLVSGSPGTVSSNIWVRSSNMNYTVNSQTVLVPDRWYLVTTVVRANQDHRLFVDGQHEGTVPIAGIGNAKENTGGITIGAGVYSGSPGGLQHFNGLIDDLRIYNRELTPDEILLLYSYSPANRSFFDPFSYTTTAALSNFWRLEGGDCGSSTLPAPGKPQGNVFCTDFVSVGGGHATLKAELLGGVRAGSGLEFVKERFPAVGTYGAKVRFSGNTSIDPRSHASVRAFFTYPGVNDNLPCTHMEHDFEVLGQLSKVNKDWYPERLLHHADHASGVVPLLTTVTHSVEQGCKGKDRFRAWFEKILGRSYYPLGALGTGSVTFIVSVNCVANCPDGTTTSTQLPTYRSIYYAFPEVNGGAPGVELKTTLTRHRPEVSTLNPSFNAWWIDPIKEHKKKKLKDPGAQYMDVDWFYWKADPVGTLEEADAFRSTGDQCNALSLTTCP